MRQWIQGTVVLGCFIADYSKGFDMIDHSVLQLIEELRKMHVHPVLVNWITAFLYPEQDSGCEDRERYMCSGNLPRVVYHKAPS